MKKCKWFVVGFVLIMLTACGQETEKGVPDEAESVLQEPIVEQELREEASDALPGEVEEVEDPTTRPSEQVPQKDTSEKEPKHQESQTVKNPEKVAETKPMKEDVTDNTAGEKKQPVKDKQAEKSPPIEKADTTEKEKETPPTKDETTNELVVTLSVTLPDGVKGKGFGPSELPFVEGDTAYDALLKTGLDVEASGRGGGTYVRGIEGVREFSDGPLSGWRFKVDGEFPSKSAGAYKLQAGQVVEWQYTVDWTIAE